MWVDMSRQNPIKALQLNQKERRELIKSRLKLAPELSNRAVAKYINCSHHTISKIRAEMTQAGQIARTDTSDKENWIKRPYLLKKPDILEDLSDRSLRSNGVLDFMQEIGTKSP